ncbi:hypothetical protein KY349_04080 [Candidatus Woesearchaeota archaeon]|jgi:hypothetical protein|nr:hypothetical protein [Candidatus Woesearchaeota archaeon]
MKQDFLYSYFRNTDCVILTGRIYNIIYGKETRNYLSFRGARFGITPGPLLSELDRNALLQDWDKLYRIVNVELEDILRKSRKKNIVDMSNPEYVLKSFAQNVISTYSMKDVLKKQAKDKIEHKGNASGQKPEMSLEELLDVKNKVISQVKPGYLSKSLGQNNMISLRGVGYALENVDDVDVKKSVPCLKLGKSLYRIGAQNSQKLEAIIARRKMLLRLDIRKRLRSDRRLRGLLSEHEAHVVDNMLNADKFYDPKKNLGFIKNSRGFFIFTKIPNYILWEHEEDQYFRFPSAKVAVKVSLNQGNRIGISNPLVIEKYRHPGLDEIDDDYQHICFQFFEPTAIKRMPAAKKVHTMLYEGCRMLMANYCSSGKAYFNLEDDDVAEIFSSYIVPKSRVNNSKVTNREACVAEMKRRQDARFKKAV